MVVVHLILLCRTGHEIEVELELVGKDGGHILVQAPRIQFNNKVTEYVSEILYRYYYKNKNKKQVDMSLFTFCVVPVFLRTKI
jgi:hypothetical protein